MKSVNCYTLTDCRFTFTVPPSNSFMICGDVNLSYGFFCLNFSMVLSILFVGLHLKSIVSVRLVNWSQYACDLLTFLTLLDMSIGKW